VPYTRELPSPLSRCEVACMMKGNATEVRDESEPSAARCVSGVRHDRRPDACGRPHDERPPDPSAVPAPGAWTGAAAGARAVAPAGSDANPHVDLAAATEAGAHS